MTQKHFETYLQKGIASEYKGTTFKSRLEASNAFFLDMLKIKWEYEPKSFLLETGHYMPDFYLPELKTWLEVKGKITEQDWKTIETFVKTKKEPIVLFGSEEQWFIGEVYPSSHEITIERQPVQLGHCSKCGHWFFCGTYGSYHCRYCNYHEGNHDIQLQSPMNFSNFENIQKISKSISSP